MPLILYEEGKFFEDQLPPIHSVVRLSLCCDLQGTLFVFVVRLEYRLIFEESS